MDDKNLPIGELFETVSYKSIQDVENMIDNLNSDQSLYMVSLALEIAVRNNLYSLQEIEIISKSLRILNKSQFKDVLK